MGTKTQERSRVLNLHNMPRIVRTTIINVTSSHQAATERKSSELSGSMILDTSKDKKEDVNRNLASRSRALGEDSLQISNSRDKREVEIRDATSVHL